MNMRNYRTALMASPALLLFSGGVPAAAQAQPPSSSGLAVSTSTTIQADQPAPQDVGGPTGGAGGVIVVTARKREERILDIPQSVTVVSGDTLERQNATTFEQYANLIPGLSLNESEPGESRISLRGVNTGGVASTVAVYVDEIPFGSSSGLLNGGVLAGDFDTFDLARLEVLRGPQGTLYGASSLGGLLKFVTNSPKLGDFSARARAGLEFVKDGEMGHNLNAVINVPIGQTAAFRASGFYRKQGGHVDAVPQVFPNIPAIIPGFLPALGTSRRAEDINDSEVYGGRGSLLFQPTDALTIRLTAIGQNIKTDGNSEVEVDPETYKPLNGDETRTLILPESSAIKYRIYNATIEYDLGFASVLSATAFARNSIKSRSDATLPFGALFNALYGPYGPLIGATPITTSPIGVPLDSGFSLKKFTQEFRLVSPSNERLEWLVGAYYTRERGVVDNLIEGTDLATGQVFSDPRLSELFTAELASKYRETAGFFNVTYHFSDRFDISGGGRWSKNKQSAVQEVGGPFALLQFGGAGTLPRSTSSESVFTYSLSPRYELNDQTAVYARVAKGYRPGGPNVIPLGAPAGFPSTYDADTITSYEIGLKTDMGRRLSLDVSAFYNDWDDIQVIGITPTGDDFNANGGTARSMGIEATLAVRPVTGLSLSANGAFIDAKLTEDTPPVTGGFDGDRLPFSPKFSFALNGDYEWPLSQSVQAFVGASLRYVGKQRGNLIGGEYVGPGDPTDPDSFVFTSQAKIPDYTTINLRAGAELGRFTIEGFVRNVANSRGVTSITTLNNAEFEAFGGTAIPGDGIRVGLTQPRTFGFMIGAKF